MEDFYVYVYLDPRKIGIFCYDDLKFGYEPFYIGKGKKNRCNNGIKDKKKCLKVSKIKSIINDGFYPIIMKLDINLSEKEAFNNEIAYIKKIGRKNIESGPLTNMTDGGDGTSGRIDTEYDLQRKRNFRHDDSWKKILSKPVIQLKDDIVINEYNSVKEASEKTGVIKQNISSALTGRYKTAGGFQWNYKNNTDKLQGHLKSGFKMPSHSDSTKLKMSNSAKRGNDHHMKRKTGKNNPRARKVYQKSLDGSIIKIWYSFQDIKRDLGFSPSNICRCCKGEVKRIGGFLWEYAD
jgi:hypothetical protein